MAAYHGGKQKIARLIASTIKANSNDGIDNYCEPFCGMLSVFKEVAMTNTLKQVKLGDINESVIKMWDASKDGWIPTTNITEEQFLKLKTSLPSAMKGFVGHQFAFGGYYFKSYAPKHSANKNFGKAAQRRIVKTGELLKTCDAEISHGSYTQFSRLTGFVIYCDPPYVNTGDSGYYVDNPDGSRVKVKWKDEEDARFWEWCKMMARKNEVFVSGYEEPNDVDVETIVEKNTHHSGTAAGRSGKTKKRTEKLFKVVS
jgi:site-specific DNA-adenine methylase